MDGLKGFCTIHKEVMHASKFDNSAPFYHYIDGDKVNGVCYGEDLGKAFKNGRAEPKQFNNNIPTPKKEGTILNSESIRSGRIERQHSQDMAIQFVTLLVQTRQIIEVTSDLIGQYTDHFANDLNDK